MPRASMRWPVPLPAEVFARAEEQQIVPGDPEVAAALLLGFLNEAAGLIAATPEDRVPAAPGR